MVTTTIDLSVSIREDEIIISYYTDDLELAYEGYWDDYEKRVLTEVKAPYSVIQTATAYEFCGLVGDDSGVDIFIQPLLRPVLKTGRHRGQVMTSVINWD